MKIYFSGDFFLNLCPSKGYLFTKKNQKKSHMNQEIEYCSQFKTISAINSTISNLLKFSFK